MLERVDLDQVLAAASQQQLRVLQIQGETVLAAEATFRDRRAQTQWNTGGTLLLEAESTEGGPRRTLVTAESSTRALLDALGDPGAGAQPSSVSPLPAEWPFQKWDTRMTLLNQIARQLWPDDSRLSHCHLTFRAEVRHFEIGREQKPIARSREESARLRIEWKVRTGIEKKTFRAEISRYHADQLLHDLVADNFLAAEVERSLSTAPPWPAPQGEIPVYWGPRAVAKITQAFLRAFEGDRVVGQRSLLETLPADLQLGFRLEDIPPFGCDREGSATQPRLLFDGQRVRSLLVDKALAEEMSVAPTGHCRRESLEKKAGIGFWRVHLRGEATLEDLKPRLEWGLSVRDLDVLDYDTASGQIRLRLANAVLLHHGEEGETIEALTFTTSLLEILRSWKWFSAKETTTGLEQTKGESKFVVEISSPSALSERLAIPGQVPAAHYW